MRVRLFINVLTITLLALAASYYAILSINLNGIYSADWTDAELIRHRCSFRLIQPEWVSSKPDTVMNWIRAEINTRIGVIAGLWLASLGIIIWRHLKPSKSISV
jgi:hypothetical protein